MVQHINTIHEEKVKMYMKCSKKELAEMMAVRDALEGDSGIPIDTIVTTTGDVDDLIFANFITTLAENQKDIPPDIHAIVQKHFWDML